MILNQRFLSLLFSALAKKPGWRHWRRDVSKGILFALGVVFIAVSGVVALVELLGPAPGFLISGVALILAALAFPFVIRIRQYFRPKSNPVTQNALADFVTKDPQTTLILALSAGFLVAEAINKKHSN